MDQSNKVKQKMEKFPSFIFILVLSSPFTNEIESSRLEFGLGICFGLGLVGRGSTKICLRGCGDGRQNLYPYGYGCEDRQENLKWRWGWTGQPMPHIRFSADAGMDGRI